MSTHTYADAHLSQTDPEAVARGHAINTIVETTEEIEHLRVLEKRESDRRVRAVAVLLDAGWTVTKIAEQTGLSYTRTYAAAAKAPGYVQRFPNRAGKGTGAGGDDA